MNPNQVCLFVVAILTLEVQGQSPTMMPSTTENSSTKTITETPMAASTDEGMTASMMESMNTSSVKPMTTSMMESMNTSSVEPMTTSMMESVNTSSMKPMTTSMMESGNTSSMEPMTTSLMNHTTTKTMQSSTMSSVATSIESSTTSHSTCIDFSRNCKRLQHLCRSFTAMLGYCRKTCNYCHRCGNISYMCYYYQGQCEKRRVKALCTKMCNAC